MEFVASIIFLDIMRSKVTKPGRDPDDVAQTEAHHFMRCLSRGAIEIAFVHLPVRPVIAAPRTIRPRLNPKIVELFPGSKLCSQPARLFSATRPSLRRLRGISILRKHLRIRPPRARHLLNIGRFSIRLDKLAQSLIKPPPFG